MRKALDLEIEGFSRLTDGDLWDSNFGLYGPLIMTLLSQSLHTQKGPFDLLRMASSFDLIRIFSFVI